MKRAESKQPVLIELEGAGGEVLWALEVVALLRVTAWWQAECVWPPGIKREYTFTAPSTKWVRRVRASPKGTGAYTTMSTVGGYIEKGDELTLKFDEDVIMSVGP